MEHRKDLRLSIKYPAYPLAMKKHLANVIKQNLSRLMGALIRTSFTSSVKVGILDSIVLVIGRSLHSCMVSSTQIHHVRENPIVYD